MDGFPLLLIVLVLVVAAWFLIRRRKVSKPAPAPTAGPVPVPAKPVADIPKNIPPAPPAVVIYEDSFRNMSVCPQCDGENEWHALRCRICGSKL